MFFYPSDQEGLAWLEASDDSSADRAYGAYGAAQRRQDEQAEEDPAP